MGNETRKIETIIASNKGTPFQTASALVKAGYGNVEQVLETFAEKIKSLARRRHYYLRPKDIDELLKEQFNNANSNRT